ncbi:MAG: hypothetical protein R3E35_14155 [Rhodocyclaceae bacterium]|jgi:hypothetical protein
MNGPMILPWIAHKAGISEARAEELWREAIRHATDKTGWVGTSDYWEAAEQRLHQLIQREIESNCLPTPEFSNWVRLQARMARLPLLAAESWSVAWARVLAARAA